MTKKGKKQSGRKKRKERGYVCALCSCLAEEGLRFFYWAAMRPDKQTMTKVITSTARPRTNVGRGIMTGKEKIGTKQHREA